MDIENSYNNSVQKSTYLVPIEIEEIDFALESLNRYLRQLDLYKTFGKTEKVTVKYKVYNDEIKGPTNIFSYNNEIYSLISSAHYYDLYNTEVIDKVLHDSDGNVKKYASIDELRTALFNAYDISNLTKTYKSPFTLLDNPTKSVKLEDNELANYIKYLYDRVQEFIAKLNYAKSNSLIILNEKYLEIVSTKLSNYLYKMNGVTDDEVRTLLNDLSVIVHNYVEYFNMLVRSTEWTGLTQWVHFMVNTID